MAETATAAEGTGAHGRKPRGSWRRWAKRVTLTLVLLLGAIVALAATGVWFLRLPVGALTVARMGAHFARTVVPGLSLGAVTGDLARGFVVHGVVMNDRFGQPAIRIGRLAVAYQVQLSQQRLRIQALRIDDLDVLVQPSQNGQLNVAELVVPSNEPPSQPSTTPTRWSVLLERLELRNAKLVLRMDPARPITVRRLALTASATASAAAARATVESLQGRIELPERPPIDLSLSAMAAYRPEAVTAQVKLGARGALAGGPLNVELKVNGPLAKLQTELDVALPAHGRLRTTGWIGVAGAEVPAYALALATNHVNLASLVAGLPPSDVNLALEAAGAGIPVSGPGHARVKLDLAASHVAGLAVSRLRAAAKLTRTNWELAALELSLGPAATIRGSGHGDLDTVHAALALRLNDLSKAMQRRLGAPVERAMESLNLAGALDADVSVSGRIAGPLSARVRAHGRDLAALGRGARRLSVDANLVGLPASPAGHLQLAAEGVRVGGEVGTLTRVKLAIDGNRTNARLALQALGQRLQAEIKTTATLAYPGGGAGYAPPKKVDAELEQLVFRGLGQDVRLLNRPRLRYEQGQQVALSELRLATWGGLVALAGTWRERGSPWAEVTLGLEDVRIDKTLPRLSGEVQARVTRQAGTATVKLRLPEQGTTLAVDAELPLGFDHGRGVPRPLLSRPARAHVSLAELKLAQLRPFAGKAAAELAGTLGLDLSVEGTLKEPTLTLAALARDVRTRDVPPVSADVKLRGGASGVELDVRAWTGSLREQTRLTVGVPLGTFVAARESYAGPLATLSTRLAWLWNAPLTFTAEVPAVQLEQVKWPRALSATPLGQARGKLAVSTHVSGSVGAPALRTRLRLSGARVVGRDIDDLELDAHAEFVTVGTKSGMADASQLSHRMRLKLSGQDALTVEGQVGLGLAALLSASPEILERARITANARINPLELAALHAALPELKALHGTLDGRVAVSGSISAPVVQSTIALSKVRAQEVAVGDLALAASYDRRQVQGTLTLDQYRGGKLRLEARAPVDKPLEAVAAKLSAHKLDLAFLGQGPVPAIAEAAGKLDVELSIAGHGDMPVVNGYWKLSDGAFRVRGVAALADVNCWLKIHPKRLELVSLAARAEKGSVRMKGELIANRLSLQAPEVALALDTALDRFPVELGLADKGFVSGAINTRLVLSPTRVAGTVKVSDTVLRMPSIAAGRSLLPTGHLDDVVFVEDVERARVAEAKRAAARQRAGKRAQSSPRSAVAASRGPAVDVQVTAGPVFVRGEELDIEVHADVHAKTDSRGRMRVAGTVNINRGSIELLGNKFDVVRGQIQLSGSLKPDPAVNIMLSRRFADVTVFVGVTGTAKHPEPIFQCEPAIYDRAQIISLIVTGRLDPGPADSGGNKAMQVGSALVQAVVGPVMRKLLPKQGVVDVMRVNVGENQDKQTGESHVRVQLEAGRYLTDRVYVAFRPVPYGASANENRYEGLMEYRLSMRWLLTAMFGDAAVGGVDVMWTFRY